MPPRRPPRIDGFDYVGPHAYFLTICTFRRTPWFGDSVCAAETVSLLLRTATTYGFGVIAYCLMPDHLHALVDGTGSESKIRAGLCRNASEYPYLGSACCTFEELAA